MSDLSTLENPLEQLLEARAVTVMSGAPAEYQVYRKGVSHRIAKLRKDLKIQVKTVKQSKKLKGSNEVKPEHLVQDVRYAYLVVLLMEKSWAQAMETKSGMEVNSSAVKRRHVISRLRRALSFYEESKFNDLVKLQADGPYAAYWKVQVVALKELMAGALAFEQRRWRNAITSYSQARIALAAVLSKTGSDSTKELIGEVLSGTVDPSLGFAAYQIDKQREQDILSLAKTAAIAGDKDVIELVKSIDSSVVELNDDFSPSAELGEIVWRNHSARVKDPDVAASILRARSADKLQDSTVDGFDAVLQAWQDALDRLHETIDKAEINGDVDQSLYVISTFLSYSLISRRIQRDLVLIQQLEEKQATKKKLTSRFQVTRDILRVYDVILQSLSQLLELPGVFNDEELFSSLTTFKKYFYAKKGLAVGFSYRVSGDRNKSLAVYKTVKESLTEKDKVSVEFHEDLLTQKNVNELLEKIDFEFMTAHALASLETEYGLRHQNPLKQSISSRLNVYPIGTPKEVLSNIVNLKGELLPVPVKPVFFDIAFNYVKYGEEQQTAPRTVEEPEEEKVSGKKKGFLGGIWRR